TAAIYAARAMLKPVVVQGAQPGGQMTITTDVENYPGFADVVQGPWLMEQMRAQAEHVGTEMIMDQVVNVELNRRPFRLEGDSGDTSTRTPLTPPQAAQRVGSTCRRKKSSKATASRPAPPATGSSTRARTFWSSAVATRPWKNRCFSPTSPGASRLCIGVIASGRNAFSRSVCSRIRRSR